MMKRIVGLALLLCAPVWAQNVDPNADSQYNWSATTGLVNIPIARALRAGTFFGAFDFKSRNLKDLFGSEFLATSSNPAGGGDQGNGSFHFMFSPLRNVEIGLLGLHDANREGNVNTLGRLFKIPPARDFSTALKVIVNEESENLPAIAVGVENLTDPHNGDFEPNARFFQRAFYAVASKAFPIDDSQVVSVHLGAGTGRFQNRPFGGLEYAFDNGLALLAEYDGFRSAFGLRYTGLRNLRATAAVQGGRPTFQIGYTFNPFELFSNGEQDDYSPFTKPGPPPGEPPERVPEPAGQPQPAPAKDAGDPPEQVPAKPDSQRPHPSVAPAPRQERQLMAAASTPSVVRPNERHPVTPSPVSAPPESARVESPVAVLAPPPPVRPTAPVAETRPAHEPEAMRSSRAVATQSDDDEPETMAPSRF